MGNNRSNANVPAGWSQQDRRFGESIKQNLDVLQGQRGDKLDRAVTFRDLLDAGIVKLASGITNFNGLSSSIAIVNEFPDLAIPPAPTNLQASGAFRNIILTWDLKLYNGHSAVQVWRHTSDVISSATMVAQVSGFTGVYADPVGSGKTFYYWVRAINSNDVTGPYNSSSGVQGVTAPDVDFLLDKLTDSITSSELASSLSAPIANLPSDTNASITNEAVTRASADSALSSSISTVSTTVAGNTAAVSAAATSINGLEAQYTVKIDLNGAVAGYGLASTTTAAGNIVSEFVVNADRFAIMRGGSNTTAASVPFIVQASATTIGGVAVPAGVYMTDAFIRNGSIINAKIADAAIDNAKIASLDAGKINAGTISTSRLNIDGSTLTSVGGVLQIANLAVTNAKIGNLAVDNAKIGNLAVSTLKIQNQAVTFPNAITTSSTVTFAGTSSGTTFSTIQTLTGTYSGAPVLISGTFAVRSYDDQALMRFRLRRGSTVLFTSSTKAVRPSPETVFIPFNFLDSSTASGSRTYTLQAYVQDQYGYYSDRTIATLEVKK